jgi:hypothetical protein
MGVARARVRGARLTRSVTPGQIYRPLRIAIASDIAGNGVTLQNYLA